MNQPETELEVVAPKESKTFDDALRTLWDKVKEAADMITELKRERQQLHTRLTSVETELSDIRAELTNKEQEIKRLKGELAHSANSNGTGAFSTEEKEVLKNKIRDLIAKINSHL